MTHARNRCAARQRQPARTCGAREWTARKCSCGAPSASGPCARAASASGTVRQGVRSSGAPSRRLQERGSACVLAAARTPVRGANTLRTSLPVPLEWPKGGSCDSCARHNRKTLRARMGGALAAQAAAASRTSSSRLDRRRLITFMCYSEETSTGGRRPLMSPSKRRQRC